MIGLSQPGKMLSAKARRQFMPWPKSINCLR